ncbi:peptidase S8 family protein [Rhizoctonia solani AG-3 Rhs1AP]|uniref:Peptidase S8 family protein n=1 Tax=Rhizoctonia solani AG-3 Rhs1AP TaxID=1086054 RepID=X8IWN8_9AGAM|nr:peptidase S8 family protein [Rhizoctonia solani AG-3 Rhs1AP]
MSFSRNSYNIVLGRPDNHVLHADCEFKGKDETDDLVSSHIDLNECLGNLDGSFNWRERNFSLTCEDLYLDGSILSGRLQRWDGSWRDAYIDLDEGIANVDGSLKPTDAPKSSSEWMRLPKSTSRSQAWKKKFDKIDFQLLRHNHPDCVPNSYIVELRPGRDQAAHIAEWPKLVSGRTSYTTKPSSEKIKEDPSSQAGEATTDCRIVHVYEGYREYSAELTGEGLLRLAESQDIERITQDTLGISAAGWNLQAISSRNPLPAGSNPQAQDYVFQAGLGVGNLQPVDVYVIDSGVDVNHLPDGRVVGSILVGLGANPDTNAPMHGTAVASIIAEVAPAARIISIKALYWDQHSGRYVARATDIIKAFEQVAHRDLLSVNRSIVNFSITCRHLFQDGTTEWWFSKFEPRVQTLIDQQIPICAAAGNDTELAERYTPGHRADVITVAASNILNQFCDSSNRGQAITIVAPGDNIHLNGIVPPPSHTGTSFAAPHVTGVAANVLGTQAHAGLRPQELLTFLVNEGTPNALQGASVPQNTVNLQLFNV